MTRPRDWVARSPLMRKGGAHVKSKTGKRMRARLDLDDALCEWYEEDESDINTKEKKDGEPMAPRRYFFRGFLAASASGKTRSVYFRIVKCQT